MTTTMRLLAAVWHDADDLAFVRACVREDDEARDAWRHRLGAGHAGGRASHRDEREARAWLDPTTHAGRRTKAFAPLVLAALDRFGLDPGRQARATLRAWRLHEQLRLDQYRAILRRVLHALADESSAPAGPPAPSPILLKGLALADTVYPQPLLRHCHDIDLLVAPDVQPHVAAALAARGFVPRGSLTPPVADPSITLTEASGLPIVLHTSAGRRVGPGARLMLPYLIPFSAAAAAAERVTIDGEPVAVLDRAHALVHVCLGGLLRHRGPASLRWMIDAWHLMSAATDADARPAAAATLSWDRVVACVREHRLGLPVAAAMLLLSRRLGAPVPRDGLDALIAEGARARVGEQARLVASFTTSAAGAYVRRRAAAASSASPASPARSASDAPTESDSSSG